MGFVMVGAKRKGGAHLTPTLPHRAVEQALDGLVGRPTDCHRRRVHEHPRVHAAEEAGGARISEDRGARLQHARVRKRPRLEQAGGRRSALGAGEGEVMRLQARLDHV